MAYLGQGAQLITNGDVVVLNIFFASIPGGAGSGTYWFVTLACSIDTFSFNFRFVYVLAILATVSLSQLR
jgi:KUP system potassium uptake protein